jgi:integrase
LCRHRHKHDLRHTFGSLAVDGGASIVQVKEWLGHSDIKTTSRYLHTASRTADADLLGAAFTAGTAAELVA